MAIKPLKKMSGSVTASRKAIQTSTSCFEHTKRLNQLQERLDAVRLCCELDNDTISAHVYDLCAELGGQRGNRVKMLVLLPERLRWGKRDICGCLWVYPPFKIVREDSLLL